MRTIAYIDAGNLYYGLLKGCPELKWLDPVALVRALLRDDHSLTKVKFYTARVRTYPHDAAAIERQRRVPDHSQDRGGEVDDSRRYLSGVVRHYAATERNEYAGWQRRRE